MIFIDNKYTRVYYSIVAAAKARTLPEDDYKENHHIIPEAFYIGRSRPGPKGWLEGNPEDPTNKVDLTAREHFICHWLLIKMTEGKAYHITVYALNGLKRNGKDNERYETKITSRVYARLKEEFSKVHSATMRGRVPWNKGIPITEEQRRKNSAAATGRKFSAESIARRVAKQRGQTRTQETKDKISASLKGKPKGPMSEVNRKRISAGSKGKSKPEGFGKHLVEAMRVKFTENNPNKREDLKKVCPHCLGKFGPSNFTRWHGNKCKHRPMGM